MMRFALLLSALFLLFLLDLAIGSVALPWHDFPDFLEEEMYRTILFQIRLPEAVAAVLVGSALAVSGLQMQTLFGNPLAGPSVLGITAGASLGAALWVLLGMRLLPESFSAFSLAAMAILGASAVLFLILLVAFRVRDRVGLLLVGIMLGHLTFALVSIGQYFSSAEQIQSYLFWSFGDLSGFSTNELALLGGGVSIGLLLSLSLSKVMNTWLLGENYAQSMGVSLRGSRVKIILLTGLLTGLVTAFAGPIGFVGMAVPHLGRHFLGTGNHQRLLPGVMLLGGIFMLGCDILAKLPGQAYRLPLNAVTALLGAPIIIWVILQWRGISGGR